MEAPADALTEVTIKLRYRDLDTLGHVNQSVYHVLLEDARIGFLRSLFGNGSRFVVARVELDYRHELRASDGAVTIATTVQSVGRSSVILRSRMTTPSGALSAEAVTVLVAWDTEQRASRALTADERSMLEELIVADD
jgi:acyl-CoA thioester hydrolase